MATAMQQVHSLFSYYDSKHKAAYGKPAKMNRIKQRWDLKLMLEDLGGERSKKVIDYYFSLSRPSHSLYWMLNNYDRLLDTMELQQEDKERTKTLKQETRRRVEEFMKGRNELGSETDKRSM